ncbi:hypothetical protein [Streptomyces sp. NPDC020983]|uniref:hypothetical protein n=1 Tax=Streptomyces sp. NPDC020983 TaxID=3365106 RepID=UPI0037B9C264
MDTGNALCLALFLAVMAGAALGLLRVDRHALPPVLTTAALVLVAGGYVAFLFAL